MKPTHVHLSDLHGYSRLAVQATLGVTNLVEAMHHTILRLPAPVGKMPRHAASGVHGAVEATLRTTSGWVYSAIRGVTNLVGGGLDAALGQLKPELENIPSTAEREAVISILNGVLGDHLTTHDNPLAITMGWRHAGKSLPLTSKSLASALPKVSSKILVLLHGHCMNELHWTRNGHSHGQVLAAATGSTPMVLRYNSGLHISTNGRALAQQLEQLVSVWPVAVTEVTIIGYSMGGLLARSAFHYGAQAGHHWMAKVDKLLFVGTPQHGSMVERAGNMLDVALEVSPYSRALARLGKIRSAGTTDLRFGNLLDVDWNGRDRFAPGADPRQPVPLPTHVQCYAIAAMIAKQHGPLPDKWVGDGLVPVHSALGKHAEAARTLNLAPSHQAVVSETTHLGLLDSQAVCAQLQQWMAQPGRAAAG
jgi:pimeloyl-ACP methyl ester carboxylesterase